MPSIISCMREMDVLLSTGEQTTVSLMAMTLQGMGYDASSLLGFQADIQTDNGAGRARIMNIGAGRIKSLLDSKLPEGGCLPVAP